MHKSWFVWLLLSWLLLAGGILYAQSGDPYGDRNQSARTTYQKLDMRLKERCSESPGPDCQILVYEEMIDELEAGEHYDQSIACRLRLLDVVTNYSDSLGIIRQAFALGLHYHWQGDSMQAQLYFGRAFKTEANWGVVLGAEDINRIGSFSLRRAMLHSIGRQATELTDTLLLSQIMLRQAGNYIEGNQEDSMYLAKASQLLEERGSLPGKFRPVRAESWASCLAGMILLNNGALSKAHAHMDYAIQHAPSERLYSRRQAAFWLGGCLANEAAKLDHLARIRPLIEREGSLSEQAALYEALLSLNLTLGRTQAAGRWIDSLQHTLEVLGREEDKFRRFTEKARIRSKAPVQLSGNRNKPAQNIPFYWGLVGLILVGGLGGILWAFVRPKILAPKYEETSHPVPQSFKELTAPGVLSALNRLQGLLDKLRNSIGEATDPVDTFERQAEPTRQQIQENGAEAAALLGILRTTVLIDKGEFPLKPDWTILSDVFQKVQDRLLPLASRQQIHFDLDTRAIEEREAYIDAGMLELMLENLSIEVIRAMESEGDISIGTGFRDEASSVLFIFVQGRRLGNESLGRNGGAAGSQPDFKVRWHSLVDKLVKGMGGRITRYADKHSFANIMVEIPVSRHRLRSKEKIELPANPLDILIVEDTPDLGHVIKEGLSAYHALWLPNGKVAWDYLQQGLRPKLILCDILMPHMSGLEFLERLREDPELSLTPVIFLTALGLEQGHQYKGFALGIDDYIVKPFSLDFLELRVQNAMKRLANRSEKGSEDGASIEDLTWLKDVDAQVQSSLGNQQFGVDSLANSLGISGRHLGRRLREITGLTPGKYITELRMHAARQLIDNNPGMKVGDVASAVGYQNAEYFSKHFKIRFGINPSSYSG